jgi:hypothetical protein
MITNGIESRVLPGISRRLSKEGEFISKYSGSTEYCLYGCYVIVDPKQYNVEFNYN